MKNTPAVLGLKGPVFRNSYCPPPAEGSPLQFSPHLAADSQSTDPDPNRVSSSADKRGKTSRFESRRKTKSGKWTDEEHRRFLEAIELYGNVWKSVESHVGTRSCAQIRSHSQKYFQRMRTKALEELRRSNQLENKVFIILKEYRNHTGAQTPGNAQTTINNNPLSPVTPKTREANSDIGRSPVRAPERKALASIPPLLIESREENAAGRPPLGDEAHIDRLPLDDFPQEGLMMKHTDEIKIELICGVDEPKTEMYFDRLLRDESVPNVFQLETGANDEVYGEFGLGGRKRRHPDKDHEIEYPSLFMKDNYEA